jgi:CDP-glucose 4,6-dehydratase
MSGDARAGLEVFRGRRVLVTGHTGFKGGWLAAWLLDLGAEVTGLALAPATEPSLFDELGLARRLDDRRGDVRDSDTLMREIAEARPDVIFHMAAQAIVRLAYAEPAPTFATNVMGTVHLLDAVRRAGRPCTVVVVTSDKCYEDLGARRPYREDDPLGGHDPYSASKGAAELVVASYRRSFFPPERFEAHRVSVATVRAGNVIGGGDWSRDRIVPDIVKALLSGHPARVRNPAAVRPWQHVLDALSGYLWLGARMLSEDPAGLSGAWNFGPDPTDAIPVSELTKRLLLAWGSGSWLDARESDAVHETGFLSLDATKAKQRLGWSPTWRVGEAIDATVAWYKAAARGAALDAVTAGQIASFTDQARTSGLAWARATPS